MKRDVKEKQREETGYRNSCNRAQMSKYGGGVRGLFCFVRSTWV
jgi:hypothetical protein